MKKNGSRTVRCSQDIYSWIFHIFPFTTRGYSAIILSRERPHRGMQITLRYFLRQMRDGLFRNDRLL